MSKVRIRYTYQERSEHGLDQACGDEVELERKASLRGYHGQVVTRLLERWSVPIDRVPAIDELDDTGPDVPGEVRLRRVLPDGLVSTLRVRVLP